MLACWLLPQRKKTLQIYAALRFGREKDRGAGGPRLQPVCDRHPREVPESQHQPEAVRRNVHRGEDSLLVLQRVPHLEKHGERVENTTYMEW